jgi:hypothetical protein
MISHFDMRRDAPCQFTSRAGRIESALRAGNGCQRCRGSLVYL